MRKIEQSIPAMLGEDDTLYYFQGRGALNWLNLAYYRRMIGDTPRTRAAMARAVWTLGSESSSNSLKGIADRFPETAYGPSAGGYRCIAHSAIMFMELLNPGSTLLNPR